MKTMPANGVKGVLYSRFGGGYFFRVYDTDHNFLDYDLQHCDLQVVISDEDAVFYDKDGVLSLDYSPETLGIKL